MAKLAKQDCSCATFTRPVSCVVGGVE
ncbi:hypothetical protein OH492_06500 [Vibrio chagasii]|nr:hypothetical protein [Vibrio chagasii]